MQTKEVVFSCNLESPSFSKACNDHYEDMHHKSNAESLQHCDPSGVLRVAPDSGNESSVVDNDGYQHGDGNKCVETCRGDLEMGSHTPV